MRRLFFLPLASLPVLSFLACGGDDNTSPSTADASPDVIPDTTVVPTPEASPFPDATTVNCTLNDKTDPVSFCVQKVVLKEQHAHAFLATDAGATGVVTSWDSFSHLPDTNEAGATAHSFYDDVSYAASCAVFHASSLQYGDNQLTPTLDDDLLALAPLLETELATLPDTADGELYARLRTTAGGLRAIQDLPDGDKIDKIADSYGRAIFKNHYFAVANAGGGDGGASDAGPSSPGGIIGTDMGGGQVAYAPADVATSALALLDLAVRNPGDPDAANWQMAARLSLDHIHARGREGTTGMYYRLLVTSADPSSDTPTGPAPADVLLSDTQATISLALVRAQTLVTNNVHDADAGAGDAADAGLAGALSLVGDYPFADRSAEAIANANGSLHSLWDSGSAGYFEGYVPSLAMGITTKSTRANAFMLAAIALTNFLAPNPYHVQTKPLRDLFRLQVTPNGGLFFVVPNQASYLRASTASFQLITSGEPHPASYTSLANGAAIEALNELWGLP